MPKMATNDEQGKAITDAVIELLHSDRLNTFQFAGIVAHVKKKLGSGNDKRIAVVINTLIASKTIAGAAYTWARYRDPNEPKGIPKNPNYDYGDYQESAPPKGLGDAKESAYKAEVEGLKKEVSNIRNELTKEIDRSRNLSASLSATQKQVEDLQSKLGEAQKSTRIVAVQVKHGEEVQRTIEGLYHIEFERVLKLAQARMNVFIYGPTGSGKTHICRQVADALDLRFGFISCTAGMGEATLGGRLLPIGKAGVFEYVPSEFVDFYENGGVYLLDELDAADPNVMLLINAALANGWITVSNRHRKVRSEMHPDFICMAAGNTIGTGADRMYSARNKLDASTMDRFSVGKVYMDYDHRLEEQICPDEELRLTLWSYREKIKQNRMERAMSTRFLRDAYRMKSEFGYSMEDIDTAFFMGWREDEENKVKGPKQAYGKKDYEDGLKRYKDKHGNDVPTPPQSEDDKKRWDKEKMEKFKQEMMEAAKKKKAGV